MKDWRLYAACRGMDPELFFPTRGGYLGTLTAKAICATCPIAAQCLEVGLKEHYGIWGGKSEKERHRIKRLRRSA